MTSQTSSESYEGGGILGRGCSERVGPPGRASTGATAIYVYCQSTTNLVHRFVMTDSRLVAT